MRTQLLLFIAAFAVCAIGTAASADEPAPANEDPTIIEAVCIQPLHTVGSIAVNDEKRQRLLFRVERGSDDCKHWRWRLQSEPIEGRGSDFAREETCPALRLQMKKLEALARTRPELITSPVLIEVQPKGFQVESVFTSGPFTGKRFRLASTNPNGMLAKWTRQTLNALEPCWNNFGQDKTRSVAKYAW
jgi:hypothetical protein